MRKKPVAADERRRVVKKILFTADDSSNPLDHDYVTNRAYSRLFYFKHLLDLVFVHAERILLYVTHIFFSFL